MNNDVEKKTIRVKEHTRNGVLVEEHDRKIGGSDSGSKGALITGAAVLGAGVVGAAAFKFVPGAKLFLVRGTKSWDEMYDVLRGSDSPFTWGKTLDETYVRSTGQMFDTDGWVVFDPKSYRHLQKTNYDDTLKAVESWMKGKNVEHGAVIDRPTGQIMSMSRGNEMNVPFIMPQNLTRANRSRLVITHNHPAHSHLSGQDVIAQFQSKVPEMRVVMPDGTVTRMRTTKFGTEELESIARVGEDQTNLMQKIFRQLEDGDEIQLGGEGTSLLRWIDDNRDVYNAAVVQGYRNDLSRNFRYDVFERLVKQLGVNDVTTPHAYAPDMDELRIEGTISKVDDDERQVFGWASITEINGEPVVDLQGDLLDTYELEKAAYDYVVNSRVGGEMHERVGKSAPKQVGTLIESMVITPEKIEKMGLPPETPHGWWIGFQVDKGEAGAQAWSKLKGGEYTGFSIHGLGKRQPMPEELEKRVIERSEQEIKGWVNRMAELAGVHPRQLLEDLEEWLDDHGSDPTDDELHNFLEDTYGDEGGELSKAQRVDIAAYTRSDGTKVEAHTRYLSDKSGDEQRYNVTPQGEVNSERRSLIGQAISDAHKKFTSMSPRETIGETITASISGLGRVEMGHEMMIGGKPLTIMKPEKPMRDKDGNKIIGFYTDGDKMIPITEESSEMIQGLVSKHLLGRHNQKDHDPTKGRTHRRGDHDTGQGFREGLKGLGGGAIVGGGLGLALTRGNLHAAEAAAAGGGILGALGGGIHGAFRGARSGGDRADSQKSPSASEPDLEGFGGGDFDLDEYKFVLQDEWNKARDEYASDVKSGNKDSEARDRLFAIEEEMEIVEELQGSGVEKSLLALAADRSSGMDEFIDNVDEIAKAFEGYDEMHSYFSAVHKHLIGQHRQKDHDPTKGKGHSREEHGDTKRSALRGAGIGGALGGAYGFGSTLGVPASPGIRGIATLGAGVIGAGIGSLFSGESQAQRGGRFHEESREIESAIGSAPSSQGMPDRFDPGAHKDWLRGRLDDQLSPKEKVTREQATQELDEWRRAYDEHQNQQATNSGYHKKKASELERLVSSGEQDPDAFSAVFRKQAKKSLSKRQLEVLEKYLGEDAL